MKQQSFFGILIIILCSYMNVSSISQSTFSLEWIKSTDGALKQEFLHQLKNAFNRNIFVETGTYAGNTTANATAIFDEIYSVELSERMYLAAQNRFRNNSKIHLYNGNSGETLQKLLPNISADAIFWLDAHYCGVGTARASSDSPIIEELKSIKNNNMHNAVILIDDLRGFYTENWPSLTTTMGLLLDINPNYHIITFGDTIIAHPHTIKLSISPCVEACSISRLFDCDLNYSINDVLRAEETIAHTAGSELDALYKFFPFLKESDDPYGILWEALILEHNGEYKKACTLFKQLTDSAKIRRIHHWRVNWYLARSAFKAGNTSFAQQELQKVLSQAPDFAPAKLSYS